jgi:DNA-binding transcriptional ArsR family regulator
MLDGPDLSHIATLVGDPARANMLSALMGGIALTASELALEAGVTPPTASSHLARLVEGGLLTVASQGRHRYYALSGTEVASMLESIAGVAASVGPQRTRPGPRDSAMREARVCYDHLAGERGVAMLDSFTRRGFVAGENGTMRMTGSGAAFFADLGIDVQALEKARRPVCHACLDWSVRRSHLAGALGAALLDKILDEKWARREPGSRVMRFSPPGRRAFEATLLG